MISCPNSLQHVTYPLECGTGQGAPQGQPLTGIPCVWMQMGGSGDTLRAPRPPPGTDSDDVLYVVSSFLALLLLVLVYGRHFLSPPRVLVDLREEKRGGGLAINWAS